VTPPVRPPAEIAPPPWRGDRVILDGLPGGPWMTVVTDASPGALAVAPPRLGGRVVPLPVGREMRVAYSVREVPCEVDAVLRSGPAPGDDAYSVRLVGPPRRLQRRSAVRVPVHLLVHAHVGEDRRVGAITENLSAGGALLRVSDVIEIGAELSVAIDCGTPSGRIELKGRVVRADRVLQGDRTWRVAVAFPDLAAADEDRLVRFVFERQRELRRRETGVD
jgi:hypothetical protein